MSRETDDLAGRLARLAHGGPGAGLPRPRSEAFARDLGNGVPLSDAAARAGFDPRVLAVLTASAPADPARALEGVLRVEAAVLPATESLRGAALYPLVLAVALAASTAIVAGVAGPALEHLPLGEPAHPVVGVLIGVGGCLLALVAIAWLVGGRVVGAAWREVDGLRFLASLDALIGAGAKPVAALRAASGGLPTVARRRADVWANWMEAGAPAGGVVPAVRGLIDPLERDQIIAAARSGGLPETLSALVDRRRLALDRAVPETLAQVELAALGVAALGIVVLGGGFLSALYGGAAA